MLCKKKCVLNVLECFFSFLWKLETAAQNTPNWFECYTGLMVCWQCKQHHITSSLHLLQEHHRIGKK